MFLKFRPRIAQVREAASPLHGTVKVDELYFGAQRVWGKRGRGGVFGVLKRQGNVFTEIVPDCARATLQAVIRGRLYPVSLIHSDGWRGYDGLVDIGFDKHFRVQHGVNEFAVGGRHINGIESFWSYPKRRLAKFNGVSTRTFYWHLKEIEFCFNYRHGNLCLALLNLLSQNPL